MDIRGRIFELMTEEDEWKDKYNTNMEKLYKEASPETKEIIDHIFINLCGYQFDSIMKQIEEQEGE